MVLAAILLSKCVCSVPSLFVCLCRVLLGFLQCSGIWNWGRRTCRLCPSWEFGLLLLVCLLSRFPGFLCVPFFTQFHFISMLFCSCLYRFLVFCISVLFVLAFQIPLMVLAAILLSKCVCAVFPGYWCLNLLSLVAFWLWVHGSDFTSVVGSYWGSDVCCIFVVCNYFAFSFHIVVFSLYVVSPDC